ncbi:MATE family efflux transporter [Oceanibium sediminis]|uniref:MATE family efflux transporter n=1 Tax=Oceanibium sediminis TaxID=2026339 RepID=UPI00351A623B
MASTGSVGLMAVFLVDFVDMIFISMLGKAELAAAIGYAGTILFFTTSISVGLAIAAGALVARALGAGDAARARVIGTHVLVAGFIMAVLFAALVWVNVRPLSALLGARGETLELSASYLATIVPTMPFLMIGMAAGAILRAHGDAQRAMWATIAGGGVNAVLDPILIFGLDLELTGAALASVAARVTIMVVSVLPLLKHYGGFAPLRLPAFLGDLRPILGIAMPAMLTNIATPLGTAYVTREMARFGEEAVAGMAIVGRLTPVTFAMIFALSGAIGPIIGQNFGAGRYDRVRGAFRDGLVFIAGYVALASLVLFLLREPLAGLFSASGLTRELVFLFCGPLALAWYFNGVIFVGNAAFNNLGHPFYSTTVNWGRNTLGTVPLVSLGAWAYGAPGVLVGQALGGVIFAAISVVLALRLIARQEAGLDVARPPAEFSRRARLVQMFHARR